MDFFIAQTIRRLLARRHELSCSWLLWRRLCRRLRERGQGETQESGAFLLGRRDANRARIMDFILYDDLDPDCLGSGIVRFDGRYFGTLWAACKSRGMVVVADIHVHPGCSQQSEADRNHPMISCAGHIALILSNFAARPISRRGVGMYKYRGNKQWATVPASERREFLYIGL